LANVFASYDALKIVAGFERSWGGAARNEVHTYAYLAALAALIDGSPASDWGYGFVGTDQATPFSQEISEATEVLIKSRLLIAEDDILRPTPSANEMLRQWESLERLAEHKGYVENAIGGATMYTPPLVRSSLQHDPQMLLASAGPRDLFDELGLDLLHSQFEDLVSAIGHWSTLEVPLSVWLSALASAAFSGLDAND
jgi:hypothetical protein